MSAYLGGSTHVLRSADPRTAEHRTRFEVTATPFPVGGAGECSECPSDAPIRQAVGEVRYRSSIFRSRIHEAVCLPCLPGLLGILASLHEGPLDVALYSPMAGDRSERVQALNAEREDLVWMLAVTPGLPYLAEIDMSKLDGITLAKGAHASDEGKYCLMEAVAYVRGVEHTDHPACVAPVLGTFGRNLNDVLPDDLRQQLVALIPDLPGTAGDGHDEERGYMALDWLVRTWLPTWLELSPACREDAANLRELGRIIDLASADRARPAVKQAQSTAAAAWTAARAAAWTAAWTAARDAARDAAWTAARDALQPTVTALQESAIELYGQMIRIAEVA